MHCPGRGRACHRVSSQAISLLLFLWVYFDRLLVVAVDCRCGTMDYGIIERVLIDPRNTSIPYWRERKAEANIDAQSAAEGVRAYEQAGDQLWSWGVSTQAIPQVLHVIC